MNPDPTQTNISLMSTPDLLNATIGLFLSLPIAVLQQPRWPKWFRALVTAFVCVAVAIARCWQQGQLNPHALLRTILIVFVTTLTTYEGFWQKTIAPAIEAGTSAATTAAGSATSTVSAFFAALPAALAAAKANANAGSAAAGSASTASATQELKLPDSPYGPTSSATALPSSTTAAPAGVEMSIPAAQFVPPSSTSPGFIPPLPPTPNGPLP